MFRSKTARVKSPEDEKEGHRPTYNALYVADEGDGIESESGSDIDIYSSNGSSDSLSSTSVSVSVSAATSISIARQQIQHHYNKTVSSSSSASTDFDSSSSESPPVSSPQQQLYGGVSQQETSFDDPKSKEKGSAKLRRILYGSSSSSYDDEYVNLSSSTYSSAGSDERENEKIKDEHNYFSRKKGETNSGTEVVDGSRNGRTSVDEDGEKSKETTNSALSLKNNHKDRNSASSTPSSGNLNSFDDDNAKDGEFFASQGPIHDDRFEGLASDRSNNSSEIQSKQSQSRRSYERRKDALAHNETVMAISTASANFSIDSRGRSSTKPKASISNSSRSSSFLPNTSQYSTSKSSRTVSEPSVKLDESRSSSRNSKNKSSISDNSRSSSFLSNTSQYSTSKNSRIICEPSVKLDESRSSSRNSKNKSSMSDNSRSSSFLPNTSQWSASKNSRIICEPSVKLDESRSSSRNSQNSDIGRSFRKGEIDSKKTNKSSISGNFQSASFLPNTSQWSTSRNSRIISESSVKLNESHSSSQNSKKADIGTSVRKGEMDYKKLNDDSVAQETANFDEPVKRSSESSDIPPILDSNDLRSSVRSGNEVERKASTTWAQTEEFNEISHGLNDMESDEVGWKPPALTTFSRSNYGKSTKEHQKKEDPNARESMFRSKEGSRLTPVDERIMKSRIKLAKNKMPPPISEIIVRPPPDDDSTIGTEGTYLERFPKNKKKKYEEKSTVYGVVPALKATKTKTMVSENATPADTKIGSMERSDTMHQIRPVENTERNMSVEPRSFPQHPQEFARLGSNNYAFSTNAVPGTGEEHVTHIPGRADPPGDAYLFSYDPRNLHKQPSIFGSSHSTRDDSFDHIKKDYILPGATASVQDFITPGHDIRQRVHSSPMRMAAWVPPSMEGKGGELDLDPTRIFIDSLMTKNRSMWSPQSTIEDNIVQPKPQTQLQSQISVALSHNGETGRAGNENSMSQHHDIMTTDVSDSKSNSTSEFREISRSESSTSESYRIDVSGDSESSMNERREISRTKYSPNAPQSQPFSLFDASFNLKTTNSSHDVKYGKITPQDSDLSVLQDKKPQEIQSWSKEFDNSESSSPLPSPSALAEYSPEQSNQPVSRGRSGKTAMLLLWFLAVLIIATAIVVVLLWQLGILTNPLDDDSQYTLDPLPTPTPYNLPTPNPSIPATPLTKAPSAAPTEIKSGINILNLIIESYPQGQPALEDPNSPQAKALKWLEFSINSGMSEEQSFLQRYALATLYYSTNGDDWTDNTGWLSEEDECYWMSTSHSICNELGEYVKLELQENNLVGTLPAELGILSDTLRSINMKINSLSGEIPSPMIADMTNLEVLDLSSNNLSGVLTRQLFDATSLTRLSLFENNLSSSIPTELGQLSKLDVLDLGSNKLTSTIPSTIKNLSKLVGLSLFNNMLTGTVPAELSGIPLEMLYIDSNKLNAPLPAEVCLLNISEFWGDCEEIQCTCCTTCCSKNFGCFPA